MNRPTLPIALLATLILAACASEPSRPVATQTPAPVMEAQSLRSATPAPVQQPSVQPGGGGYLEGDGPGADIPGNLDVVPDAVPRAEPLKPAANRPYTALGKTYVPLDAPGRYKEQGVASWYGKKFHGKRTSSGEVYDMYAMTAAHPTLPIPSFARITNLSNNKSVIVRINDRGPFLHDRIIDLSYTAAHKLDIIGKGSSHVEVESLAPGAVTAPLMVAKLSSEPLPPAAPVSDAPAPAAGNAYLQLGAFRSQQGAESFLAKLRAEFGVDDKTLSLYRKDDLVRVHMGPYASVDEARGAAEKLQVRLGFKPLVSLR